MGHRVCELSHKMWNVSHFPKVTKIYIKVYMGYVYFIWKVKPHASYLKNCKANIKAKIVI